MLDQLHPYAEDHPSHELVDAVRDTMTVSRIPRLGRTKDGDGLRLRLRPPSASTVAPTRTSIVATPPVTFTFTASPQAPTGS
jgi:hypothetical protein